jgi:hypothetical protein
LCYIYWLKDDSESLWGKKNPGLGIIEDQVKIEENSMIQTTRVLNVEAEKIEDIGRTADPLELLYDPANTSSSCCSCNSLQFLNFYRSINIPIQVNNRREIRTHTLAIP